MPGDNFLVREVLVFQETPWKKNPHGHQAVARFQGMQIFQLLQDSPDLLTEI